MDAAAGVAIGLGCLSPYGFCVAAYELTLFAPLMPYALSRGGTRQGPRTPPVLIAIGGAAWVTALWRLGVLREQVIPPWQR